MDFKELKKHYSDYKEAFDNIEDKNSNAALMIQGSISALELLFPELKESEDERIRKWLIGYFHQYKEDGMEKYANGLKVESIIAWLEQKPVIEMKSVEESLGIDSDTYNKIVDECIYGEQKTANPLVNEKMDAKRWKDACKAACCDNNYRSHFGLTETRDDYFVDGVQWADEHPLQNPTWSKEDDKHLQIAINYTFSHGYLSTVDWLRTLKNRMQPKQEWKQENTGDLTDFENAMMHIGGSFFGYNAGLNPNDTNSIKEQANLLLELVPKQEWSEEDEKILSDIITSMTNLKDSATSDALRDIYNSKIDWLKSLRPQNTWKPSDKQMEVLYEVIKNPYLSTAEYNGLVGLKEQLKAL